MRFISILVGALVLIGALNSRRAEACGGGNGDYGSIIVAAVVVGGAYVGTTATFAIKDIATSDHSVGYGVAETAINGPLTVMFGLGTIAMATSTNDTSAVATYGIFTAIHGSLLAHGIYTIGKKRERKPGPRPYNGPPGMMQVGRVSAVVAPAAISNGGGIGLAGTF